MKRILNVIKNLDYYLQPVFFLILLVVLVMQVMARFILVLNFPWTLEVITFTFNASVWLGISLGVKEFSHVGIEIILHRLAKRHKKMLKGLLVFQYLLFVFVIVLFAWSATIALEGYFKMHSMPMVLPIPLWILRSPVILGAAFCVYRIVQMMILIFKGEYDYSRFYSLVDPSEGIME